MKKYRCSFSFVVVTLIMSAQLHAAALQKQQSIDSSVGEAETLIKKGDFSQAARAYQQAIDAGARCASMYYNHGTAALKAGQPGPAVLSFERGLRLAPDDEDLQYNLHQALSQISGPLAAAALLPRPQAWLLRWSLRQMQAATLALWALALLLIFARLLLLRYVAVLRRVGLLAAWSLFVLATLSSLLSLERQQVAQRGDAVMIAAKPQPAREADDAQAPQAFTVQPGQPLQVIERRGDWARVELLNGLQAWLPKSTVAELWTSGSRQDPGAAKNTP